MPRNIHGKPVMKEKGDETMNEAGMAHMAHQKEVDKHDEYSEPDYPYGLRLRLDHESMKKCGVKEMPAAGEEVHIRAKAHVSGARSEKHEGENQNHIELQITHLGVHHKEDGMASQDQGGKKKIEAGHVTEKMPKRKRH